MNRTQRREEMNGLIEQRLDALRSMSPQELQALRVHPEFPASTEDVMIDGRLAKLLIYHQRSGNQHRVIVQGVRLGTTGMSALVVAKGFLFGEPGFVRDLRDDELYAYI